MQTVIGVFDNRAAASKALDILMTSGFDTSNVHMQGQPFVSEPAGQPPEPEDTGDGFFGTVSHYLHSVFGEDEAAKTHVYSEAVRRGGYVVSVDADDEEEADEVQHLFDDAGAVDIEERVGEWKAGGWDAGTTTGSATGDAVSSDWKRGPSTPKGGM